MVPRTIGKSTLDLPAGIRMPPTLDALLTSLEAAKGRFGRGASAHTQTLLEQLARHQFRDAKSLIRFHESLLFLRAFPQSRAVVAKIEQLLDTFHKRVEKLRELGVDMSVFDDFDTSGIAGTTMQDARRSDCIDACALLPRNGDDTSRS